MVNVSILLPQNAVNGDVSVSINNQNVPPDTSSFLVEGGITYLISDLYDIKPFNQTLNKPGILRIGFPDSTCLITEAIKSVFQYKCDNKHFAMILMVSGLQYLIQDLFHLLA